MKKIKDDNYSTNDDKEKESNVDKEEVKNEKELDKKKEVVIENNLKEKEIEKEEQDIKLDDKVEEETIKPTSTNKQKINKKENGNFWQKNKNVLISIVITFAICLGIFGLFYNYYLKNLKQRNIIQNYIHLFHLSFFLNYLCLNLFLFLLHVHYKYYLYYLN